MPAAIDTTPDNTTIDADEVARFSAMADEWWDPAGNFKPLHKFNPVRLGYIRDRLCAHFGRDPHSLTPLEGLTLRDGGATVLATLNRTPKAFIMGIVGAEYVMRWLPRGTHNWRKFVRPSELAAGLRRGGIDVTDISGLSFDLLGDDWRVSDDVSVNYILFGTR